MSNIRKRRKKHLFIGVLSHNICTNCKGSKEVARAKSSLCSKCYTTQMKQKLDA